MKKFLLLICAIFFLAESQSTVKAQQFQNGDLIGNLGLGFGWYGYGYGTSSFPAIILSMEKGITVIEDVAPVSIGGVVSYKHASYNYTSGYDYNWNDIVIAARGAIYYDLFKNEKVDTYGAVAIGMRFQSYTDDFVEGNTTTTNGLFGIYVGGRYYFSDQFAAFGELGYGYGYLNLGVSYKFK